MDWDWEDGPPRDSPPASSPSGEPRPSAEQVPCELEASESAPPEPLDESVTQVFSADRAWDQPGERTPFETAPQSPPPEYVLPESTETGRPAAPDDTEFARLPPQAAEVGAGRARRPRSPQDRAARREQRRRQLRRRRLVALTVLVAIVVLIVIFVIRGCGGSDAAAAAVLGVLVLDGRLVAPPGRQ